MVKEGIELIGGMKSIVKQGDRILLKPSIPVLRPPESGMISDLRILEVLIELANEANVDEILIVESSATIDLDQDDELQEILRRTGAKAVDLNKISDADIITVKVPKHLVWEEIPIPRLILDSDILINIPKLKT